VQQLCSSLQLPQPVLDYAKRAISCFSHQETATFEGLSLASAATLLACQQLSVGVDVAQLLLLSQVENHQCAACSFCAARCRRQFVEFVQSHRSCRFYATLDSVQVALRVRLDCSSHAGHASAPVPTYSATQKLFKNKTMARFAASSAKSQAMKSQVLPKSQVLCDSPIAHKLNIAAGSPALQGSAKAHASTSSDRPAGTAAPAPAAAKAQPPAAVVAATSAAVAVTACVSAAAALPMRSEEELSAAASDSRAS